MMHRRTVLPALLGMLGAIADVGALSVPPRAEREPWPRRLNVNEPGDAPTNRAGVPWRDVLAEVRVDGVTVSNAFAYDLDEGWVDRFAMPYTGAVERVFGAVEVIPA
jgi:hypothetical protein